MIVRITACTLAALLATNLLVGNQGTSAQSLSDRPRIGMNRSDVTAIVGRLSSGGEWHDDFKSYVSYLDSVWNDGSTQWEDLAMRSLGAAFIYSLRSKGNCCSGVSFSKTTAQYASQALHWATSLKNLDTAPPGFLVEHAYHSTFFVYDWINDTLDQGTVAAARAGAPQWSSEQHSRGFARKVLAGLACAGDGVDDGWCQSSYQGYSQYIRHETNGMVSRETQRGGTDGSWIQGLSYGLSYNAHHLALVEMGWRTANGISKASHYTTGAAGYWHGLGRLATYYVRPWAAPSSGAPDGHHWRYVKDVYSNADATPFSAAEDLVWWGMMRRELQGVDDDAAGLAAWYIAHRAYGGGADRRYWVHTKFLGPRNAERSPTQIGLPPQKAFKFGGWMWRTGWENRNDALLTVFGYEFSGFSSAVGSFSVDYMGPSIVLPGVGGHDVDTSWHGFANSVGAPENRSSAETSNPTGNDDYGFHRTYNPITPDFRQNTYADWLDRTEKFVGGEGNNDYGYLWVDRTRSMNSSTFSDQSAVGNVPKISGAARAFAVFLPKNPGTDTLRVIISDVMTTLDSKFEKRSVLYYSGTPTVDGAASAGPSRGNPSSTTGKTTYSGATTITARSGDPAANNRLWVRPLFPENSRVVLVNFRRNNEVEDSYGLMHGTSGFSTDIAGYIGHY
jgi:hypothetical protein